jgi:hypothetical protein
MVLANKNMIVLHPFPRNEEISPEIDDDPRCKYIEQMKNGSESGPVVSDSEEDLPIAEFIKKRKREGKLAPEIKKATASTESTSKKVKSESTSNSKCYMDKRSYRCL